jgi:hypothetical protein
MNRTTTRLLAAAAIAVVMLASCADAAGWYPSGTATVAGSYEYDDLGVRSLVVTATIENTGASAISRSTLTITATTGTRTYWKTVSSETRVLPGAKIKVTSAVAYADAVETLLAGQLSIGDAFFE